MVPTLGQELLMLLLLSPQAPPNLRLPRAKEPRAGRSEG